MKEEKIVFKNSEGLNLIGILNVPKEQTDTIIVLAHGFTSNKDRNRYIEISKSLVKEGYAFLRFDFGGSGESDENEITVKNQIDDLKSAINFVKDKKYRKIGLIGESLGGLIVLSAYPDYQDKIKCIALVAPVTQRKTPTLYDDPKIKVEIEEKGFHLKHKDGKIFKVPKEYIDERENINQEEILNKIKCPVLIIHGSEDNTIPVEHSNKAMEYLSENSKLEIIKGADHDLDIRHGIVTIINKWFKKHLK